MEKIISIRLDTHTQEAIDFIKKYENENELYFKLKPMNTTECIKRSIAFMYMYLKEQDNKTTG